VVLAGAALAAAALAGVLGVAAAFAGVGRSGVTLAGAALAGVLGVAAAFAGVGRSGVALAGAVRLGADFAGVDLAAVAFAGADLAGADFAGADFAGADFAGADFAGAGLAAALRVVFAGSVLAVVARLGVFDRAGTAALIGSGRAASDWAGSGGAGRWTFRADTNRPAALRVGLAAGGGAMGMSSEITGGRGVSAATTIRGAT
jgi:hypothetical protein